MPVDRNIILDSQSESAGLTVPQRSLIGELDPPIVRQEMESSVNTGEHDITARIYAGQLWLYKTWKSRRQVDERHFVYAASTGRVHRISAAEFEFLRESDWRTVESSSRSELVAALHETISPLPASGWSFPDVPRHVNRGAPPARILILNPIEQCNIRCTYCYFGGNYVDTRLHRTAWTPPELMKEAIESFLRDSPDLKDAWRAVHFFGGEPLMAFKRIQLAIEGLESHLATMRHRPQNLIVQLTTNALLLDESIAKFLVEHDVYMNISIDGPNHDRYRVDKHGKGTHDRVRERIEWLADAYPEYFSSHVGLTCVLNAPFDVRENYQYFCGWPAARSALSWDFDLVLPDGTIDQQSLLPSVFAQERLVWDLFVAAHARDRDDRNRSMRYHFAFRHGFLHRSFHQALSGQRVASGPTLKHLLGVQVVPGCEFLVVGSDGTLYSSYEFQADSSKVGHLDDGVDYRLCLSQLAAFRDAIASSSCTTCWAAPICTLMTHDAAFRAGDDEPTIRRKVSAKAVRCRQEREALTEALMARADIEDLYGAETLQPHLDEWELQKVAGARVDYFYKRIVM